MAQRTFIREVRLDLTRIITEVTPDIFPSVQFLAASGRSPLEGLKWGRSWQDASRRFHVVLGSLSQVGGPRYGDWNGKYVHRMPTTGVIRIRYRMPIEDEQYLELCDMVASDELLISAAIGTAAENWSIPQLPILIELTGAPIITPVGDDGIITEIPFDWWVDVPGNE